MSYLFIILVCSSISCSFVTNGELVTLEKCSKTMETFQKTDAPAGVQFSVASCVKVKDKEKSI